MQACFPLPWKHNNTAEDFIDILKQRGEEGEAIMAETD